MNIIIFRENTEDVYAGIEWREGTPQAKRLIEFVNALLKEDNNKKQVRLDSGIGIKPMSITGTKRLARRALQYAIAKGLKTVTLIHKGNIMKFTEGSFRDWGYELAKEEFRAQIVTERESWILGNKDKDPNLSVEANAAMVEPGLEMANDSLPAASREGSEGLPRCDLRDARQGAVEKQDPGERPHCGFHAATNPDAGG